MYRLNYIDTAGIQKKKPNSYRVNFINSQNAQFKDSTHIKNETLLFFLLGLKYNNQQGVILHCVAIPSPGKGNKEYYRPT